MQLSSHEVLPTETGTNQSHARQSKVPLGSIRIAGNYDNGRYMANIDWELDALRLLVDWLLVCILWCHFSHFSRLFQNNLCKVIKWIPKYDINVQPQQLAYEWNAANTVQKVKPADVLRSNICKCTNIKEKLNAGLRIKSDIYEKRTQNIT